MKQIKIYLFALLAVLSMAACSSSDDGDGNGSNEINTNKNEATTDKAVTRLEFPKLKGGNSIIRVYRDGNSKQYDPDNVNYSVEWIATRNRSAGLATSSPTRTAAIPII